MRVRVRVGVPAYGLGVGVLVTDSNYVVTTFRKTGPLRKL